MALTDENLYAYCDNNPVGRLDCSGAFWEEVGNSSKNVGASIHNGVKKLFKVTVESFQLEVGMGHGFGAPTEYEHGFENNDSNEINEINVELT